MLFSLLQQQHGNETIADCSGNAASMELLARKCVGDVVDVSCRLNFIFLVIMTVSHLLVWNEILNCSTIVRQLNDLCLNHCQIL